MSQSDDYLPQIKSLLQKARLSTDILQFKNCAHGGNNRTYRLETADGVFAVKKYFRGPNDKRDRLTSEFSFLEYAKRAAPDFVPFAYASDAEYGLALYEFIEGSSLKPGEITEHELSQAIAFFCLLNDPKMKASALHLPLASEAGFSIQDHLYSVNTRIRELQQAVSSDNEINSQDARELIETLSERWCLLVNECKKIATMQQIDIDAKLDVSQRCISPSDFGFHNALRAGANNNIRFIDFEYAGWDDPGRMVNDFFSQLAVPIPPVYYERFVQEVMTPFPQADQLVQRARLLKAVYRIKWCCIALNIFIPVHMARRQFANPNLNVVDLRKTQLAKAELLLKTVEVSNYASY
ncbi:phosphotransferase [Aquicella lusitana]|uniref:Phosphotransferase family enzyme n=1 Tax=Aquicella lusitana TaxID=254246 RepID=A0A370GWT7_9COXI|nr:phosphotransferase [Aquicella lusitana]RDI48158.1 phosphotransferase family enzyme [Aquicella lusitana]VVC72826.1 hypothetical protein AQULUS_05500 [Aquicella lusitana]